MESILVVYKFIDMFPADLPGVPLDKNINFPINGEPDTKPISIPPYRMALTMLKEKF